MAQFWTALTLGVAASVLSLGACRAPTVHPPSLAEIEPIQLAPVHVEPAADAVVRIFEYSTEPCIFTPERDGFLLGLRFSWRVERDRIPLYVQGTGPLRREPSIDVNQYQLCILYGTQQCKDDFIQRRLAADGLVPPQPGMPPLQPFDPNVPAKAWRIFQLTQPPYLRRTGASPLLYEFFPGAASTIYFPSSLAKPDPSTGALPQLYWQVRACGTNPLVAGGLHCYDSSKRPIKFECQFKR